MVGKWHEGYFQRKFLPINRGFDTSSGFLSGAENHFNEQRECAVDFWKNDSYDTRNGTYDSYIYKDDLKNIFDNHKESDPLFLYLPLHNVHGPFQAPDEWLDKYAKNSTCDHRRTYQAMVSVADNVTGYVVDMLKQKGMWDNTFMVVSADNGGAECSGSNHPLKGAKGTFYEGGVRALAFASGGLIPSQMIGKSVQGFIHIADWYATFCNLADVDPTDSGPGKFPVDGVDVWPLITGKEKQTVDKEIVLGFNFSYGEDRTNQGAIIVGNNKLIIGPQGGSCDSLMWSPIDYPCSEGKKDSDCDPYCVFNVVDDPEERQNLAKQNPSLLKSLLDKYSKYSDEPRHMQDQGYHSANDVPTFKKACDYMKEHGGYWQPWENN